MSATVLKNSFDVDRSLYGALRRISQIMGQDFKIPTTPDRAAFVASRLSESLEPPSEKVFSGADTTVTVAINGTDTYTVTADGTLIYNDFSGAGQVVNLNGTAIYTVVATQTLQMRVKAGDVVTVVDTADAGTTFKRNFVARF